MATISGDIEGTSQSIGLVSGLALPVLVSGVIAGIGSATGAVSGCVPNFAQGSATGTVIGVSRVIGTVTGQGSATSTVSGYIRIVGKAQGQGSATATESGGLTQIVGKIVNHGSSTGVVTGASQVIGSISGQGSAKSTVSGAYRIIGSITASASATGVTKGRSVITGVVAGQGSATTSATPLIRAKTSASWQGSATASAAGVSIVYGKAAGKGGSTGVVSGGFVSKSYASGSSDGSVNGHLQIVGNIVGAGTAATYGSGSAGTTWFDRYWNALVGIIQTAWPEVTNVVATDISIERRDWINDIDTGRMAGTWCVVSLDINPTDQWGNGPKDEIAATVFYIMPLSGAQNTGKTATTYIADKLAILQKSLYASALPWSLGTVLDDIPIDVSAENPVNVSMLDADRDYQGGSLTVTSVVKALG